MERESITDAEFSTRFADAAPAVASRLRRQLRSPVVATEPTAPVHGHSLDSIRAARNTAGTWTPAIVIVAALTKRGAAIGSTPFFTS